jgi:hypothetical protein
VDLMVDNIRFGLFERICRVFFYHLGDNCIVFENFTASIADLMVAN